MGIKGRLVVMNFLEFFVWGSWLISLGNYMGATLGFSGLQIGGVYTTMGIASLFMPGLLGCGRPLGECRKAFGRLPSCRGSFAVLCHNLAGLFLVLYCYAAVFLYLYAYYST